MGFIRTNDIDISKYLPEFVTKDNDLNAVLKTFSSEHSIERNELLDILNQFFISSATWGLDAWEKVFDIYSKPTDSYELRRAKIYTKLQAKQISTVEFLRQMCAKYFPKNSTVQIKEENEKNLFYLIANSTALDNDYNALRDAIEIYKPAHLACIIQHFLDGNGGFGVGGLIQQAQVIRLYQSGAKQDNNTEGF